MCEHNSCAYVFFLCLSLESPCKLWTLISYWVRAFRHAEFQVDGLRGAGSVDWVLRYRKLCIVVVEVGPLVR